MLFESLNKIYFLFLRVFHNMVYEEKGFLKVNNIKGTTHRHDSCLISTSYIPNECKRVQCQGENSTQTHSNNLHLLGLNLWPRFQPQPTSKLFHFFVAMTRGQDYPVGQFQLPKTLIFSVSEEYRAAFRTMPR